MIDSVSMLLNVLRQVQLFAPDQVDEIERELGPIYADPAALGEYLVEIKWLTPFQFQMLFEGRGEELNFGPYTLLERLGESDSSEVVKAWDTNKGRLVALKMLRPSPEAQSPAAGQDRRELEILAQLNHRNIIKIFEAHELDRVRYFVMELVEGMDLHEFVAVSGPLPLEQACDFARQVGQALQQVHQLGMVHRGIRPANLFLLNPPLQGKRLENFKGPVPKNAPEPIVKILDWGLARLTPAAVGEGEPVAPANRAAVPEAEKAKLIATAEYIAPEQACDASLVDVRADIYSLGCAFFYLLTGKPPFSGESLAQRLRQHQEEPAPPVQKFRPDVPDELAEVLAKMLAKKPEDRFQIPLLVVGALRRFAAGLNGAAANGTGQRPSSSFSLNRPASSASIIRGPGR